jgi:hypothetical protein
MELTPKLISFSTLSPNELVIAAVLRTVGTRIESDWRVEIIIDGEVWGNANLDAKLDPSQCDDGHFLTVQILQLRNKFQVYNEPGSSRSVAGLILQPTETSQHYRRMGVFSIRFRWYWEALFEGQEQTQVILI